MIKAVIVEDDPMVAMVNQQFLMKASQQINLVATFTDGQTAWEFLQDHPVDLVILDIYLPRLNGLELLEKIRASKTKTDVIMVTAANNKEAISDAIHLGIIDYLIKPFNFERFQKAIHHFLEVRNILKKETALKQSDIDSLFVGLQFQDKEDLPKGLQIQTLNRILRYLQENPATHFTCKGVSVGTGLSVVTAQRYLNYLVSQQQIHTSIDYHTGGRPKIVYIVSP
jgi:response regulator of citrate/malate metabolism